MPETMPYEEPIEEHRHDYKLKIIIPEIMRYDEPILIKFTNIYAECKCGAKLDQQEIEEIINAKR